MRMILYAATVGFGLLALVGGIALSYSASFFIGDARAALTDIAGLAPLALVTFAWFGSALFCRSLAQQQGTA